MNPSGSGAAHRDVRRRTETPGGRGGAGDRTREAPDGLTGASAAKIRRAESVQHAEQLLRRIVDHPEQVLAARLRNAQKLRERAQ